MCISYYQESHLDFLLLASTQYLHIGFSSKTMIPKNQNNWLLLNENLGRNDEAFQLFIKAHQLTKDPLSWKPTFVIIR